MLPGMDPLTVLILAPDPLARAGLAQLLAEEASLHINGQLSMADALAELPAPLPDAVLWDLGWDPPESLPDLGELGLPVLALVPAEEDAGSARGAGAAGILLRQAAPSTIAAALVAVVEGLFVTDLALLGGLLPSRLGEGAGSGLSFDDLTPREMDVLQLLAQGVTNRAIGQALHISEYTVKFHVNAIMSKLAAQSRTEAVVTATRAGLISL